MSAEAFDASLVIPPPQFSAEGIEAALALGRAYPGRLIEQQRGLMQVHNLPLLKFYEAEIAGFASRAETEQSNAWRIHYIAGHAALRTAVSQQMPLPERTSGYLYGYTRFMKGFPEIAAKEFDEDYDNHPEMREFVEGLSKRSRTNADGARFILGAYGSWANPERGDRQYSPVSSVPQPIAYRKSPQERRNAKAYAVNKRFAK